MIKVSGVSSSTKRQFEMLLVQECAGHKRIFQTPDTVVLRLIQHIAKNISHLIGDTNGYLPKVFNSF